VNLVSWITIIIVALWAAIRSANQAREFKGVQWYPLYFAVASIIQLVIFRWWPRQYNVSFWVFQFADNIICCFLTIEIISRLVQKIYAVLWAIAAALAFFSSLFIMLADKIDDAASSLKISDLFLDISRSCVIAALLLISILLAIHVKWKSESPYDTASFWTKILGNVIPSWKREYKLGIAGVLMVLVGDYLSFKMWGNSFLVQFAPLAGLILMAFAGSKD
jgi:hypothetical protein